MPRHKRKRKIFFQPDITYFRPRGILSSALKEITISFDEIEAIRLVDKEGTEQNKAGKKMGISQSTLSRLLKTAREKLADAIINGKAIKIQGGNFEMNFPRGRGFGRGMGGQGSFGAGGFCVCPKCGYKEPHKLGEPCYKKKCPKCGTPMTRSD